MVVTRPALRYHGGKWRLGKWIIGHFPPHVCYCEPFGGGANILLQKEPSPFEVYNDLDGGVVAFFRLLRERPDDLIRAIELTPFSREEQEACAEATEDDLERARRLYVGAWQARGRLGRHNDGWRFMRGTQPSDVGSSPVKQWNATAHLYDVAARLKAVQIEREDAIPVIRRFDSPTTLFYVDPPYVMSTRSTRWGKSAYAFELTDDEHRALADTLHQAKGMVALSGYACPLYDELYRDWRAITAQTQTQVSTAATEVLWLNPAAASAVRQRPLPLEMTA